MEVEETSHFYTYLWSPRQPGCLKALHWVRLTYFGMHFSIKKRGLRAFLRENFGRSAVGSTKISGNLVTNYLVLVNEELWTDESVFWQGKLKDGAEYMVVHCT